ncbi:unnamed protein product [Periconia digitata]|uniref:Uncharacterized protein n=1 Tax=Periconia digitata TaxID=1303443 RepID=A0A9W4XDZ5_9PLEO|nr:unnamed protein product [Periconia digitata]
MIPQPKQIEEALSSTLTYPQKIDKIAQIRRWFQPKEDSKIYPQIQTFLSTSDLSHDTFLPQLTAPIDEALSTASHADDLESTWWDLWNSILHASKRIPYSTSSTQHERLASLVEALKSHQDPTPNNLSSPAWSSLPWLHLAVREAFNDTPHDDDDSPPSSPALLALEASAFANLNYFLATLTSSQVAGFANPFALWSLRSALETDFSTTPWCFDARVPAAAVWVTGAIGRIVYETEIDMTPPQGSRQGNPGKGGELWDGVSGFGKERWGFWKKRFGDVLGIDGVSKETREVAKRAVEGMEGVEQGKK